MTIPAGKRRCSRCREVKDIDCFPPSHTYCHPCFATYNRERAKKRKEFTAEFVATKIPPLGEDTPRRRGRPPATTDRPKWNGERGHRYQGLPCDHGHSGERYVKNNNCVQCALGRSAAKAPPKKGRKKPVRSAHLFTPLTKPDLPPPPPLEEVESVEQFLARGGRIQKLPHGATGYRT